MPPLNNPSTIRVHPWEDSGDPTVRLYWSGASVPDVGRAATQAPGFTGLRDAAPAGSE